MLILINQLKLEGIPVISDDEVMKLKEEIKNSY